MKRGRMRSGPAGISFDAGKLCSTATQRIPAVLAAVIPLMASSMTQQFSGRTFILFAAAR